MLYCVKTLSRSNQKWGRKKTIIRPKNWSYGILWMWQRVFMWLSWKDHQLFSNIWFIIGYSAVSYHWIEAAVGVTKKIDVCSGIVNFLNLKTFDPKTKLIFVISTSSCMEPDILKTVLKPTLLTSIQRSSKNKESYRICER